MLSSTAEMQGKAGKSTGPTSKPVAEQNPIQLPAVSLLAYDMDGTTVYNPTKADNGLPQDYVEALPIFRRLHAPPERHMIYITGRDQQGISEGIERCDLPQVELAVGMVGTALYERIAGELVENPSWTAEIQRVTPGWSINTIVDFMARQGDKGICPQDEHERWQGRFKSSWYVRPTDRMLKQYGTAAAATEHVAREVESILRAITACKDLTVVDSFDSTREVGLIDVLPAKATKHGALEFVRIKLFSISKEQTLVAGDTGNDLDLLTGSYYAVLVGNAKADVKKRASALASANGIGDKLYIAKRHTILGIIEGIEHHQFLPADPFEGMRLPKIDQA